MDVDWDAYWAGFRLRGDSIPVGSYLAGSVVAVRWDVCQDGYYYRANRGSCPAERMVEKAAFEDGFGLDDPVASWVGPYWVGPYWVDLYWVDLYWVDLYWVDSYWVDSYWVDSCQGVLMGDSSDVVRRAWFEAVKKVVIEDAVWVVKKAVIGDAAWAVKWAAIGIVDRLQS